MMMPKEIWAGNNTVTYTLPGGSTSVTFQDGDWSACDQPGWTSYVRGDLHEALLARAEAAEADRDRMRTILRASLERDVSGDIEWQIEARAALEGADT